HRRQPGRRVLAATGDRQRAERARPLEAGPESDEEPERERKEDAVGRAHARPAQHEAPAARPPLPRFLRVEPEKRRAARPRRLVHAHVALERIRQIGAERRSRGLIGHELGFARERQPAEVEPIAQIVDRREAGPTPFPRDELVGGEQLAGHGAKAAPLVLAQPVGLERLEGAVEHYRRARASGPKLESLDLAGGRLREIPYQLHPTWV